MPRQAMKRPAAALELTKKKAKVVDPVKEKCDLIASALISSEQLHASVSEMLTSCIPQSLNIFRDERHAFQHKAVEMIEAALVDTEAAIKACIVELETQVSGADAERAQRDSNLVSAKEAIEAMEKDIQEKSATLAEDEAALATASEALVAAHEAQEMGNQEMDVGTGKKEELHRVVEDVYTPLKEGMSDKAKAKRQMASLLASGKKFDLDMSLISALPVALGKVASERGNFDHLVLQQFEDAISQKVASIKKLIEDGEPAKAKYAEVVEASQAAELAAKSKRDSSKDALGRDWAALKELKAAQKFAKKKVDDFVPELKAATSAQDAKQQHLSEFLEGPLAAFKELKERSTPVVQNQRVPEPEDTAAVQSSHAKSSPAKSPAKVNQAKALAPQMEMLGA